MPRQVPLGSGCQRVQESIGKFNALLVGVFEYFLDQILVLDFVFGSVDDAINANLRRLHNKGRLLALHHDKIPTA